jgi:hypothetical protein
MPSPLNIMPSAGTCNKQGVNIKTGLKAISNCVKKSTVLHCLDKQKFINDDMLII